MFEIIRIEHPESGNGIFTHRFSEWECLREFFDRHNNLPTPMSNEESDEMRDTFQEAVFKDRYEKQPNEWFCAYKSFEQLLEWVLEEEFENIIRIGFRFYSIKVESCVIGNYQCIFKKKDIIEKTDITYLFEKLEKIV